MQIGIFKSAGLICMLCAVSFPADRPGKKAEPPWEMLENQLQALGVATNSQSLIREASGGSDQTKWYAMEIIGLRGVVEAAPTLGEVARDVTANPLLRDSAAVALTRLKSRDGLGLLRARYKEADLAERQIYLAARLAEAGDPVGFSTIATSIEAKEPRTRIRAVTALPAFRDTVGAAKIVTLLERAAADVDVTVRKEAVSAMPNLATGAARPAVRLLLERLARTDQDLSVRELAQTQLSYLFPAERK